MQIFSKLQRNSINYILIKIIFWFFIAVLNSKFLFFPLLLGVAFFCENIFIAVIYLGFFCATHYLQLGVCAYIFGLFIVYKVFLYKKFEDLLNPVYRPIVSAMFIYAGLFLVFGFNNLVLTYILYNMAFDIVLIRVIKCEPTSL